MSRFRRHVSPSIQSCPTSWLLAAALAAIVVGGCSCEKPRIRPVPTPMGHEVPNIRVMLGDEAPLVAIAVTGPWRLVGPAGDVGSGESLGWTDVACQKGQVLFGNLPPTAGTLELRPERDGSIWVAQAINGKDRERAYRGVLRLVPTASGTLRVINVLPIEPYVAGVVANELFKSWHLEAYKAQAVAARTFALIEHNQRVRYDYDVRDSTLSQVYGGAATETKTSWDAVTATMGIVATYRGKTGKPTLLKTYYHSTCGGGTVSATSVFGGSSPEPLAGGVPCTWCRNSRKFTWPDVVITKKEITDAMKKSGIPELVRLGPIKRVEVSATAGSGGRAEEIRLTDAAGAAVDVHAGTWRGLVGAVRMPSTWFTIEDQPDRIVLKNGRGFGHGVGLCQYGAQYLAEHGRTGEQILRYYYPGVQLTRAY